MTNAEDILAAQTRLIGTELGVSDWVTIDQAMIDAFANVTRDHQFIHVNPHRAAAETEHGGTIAHGFLTLSLASHFHDQAVAPVPGERAGYNYGFDRVRFPAPVRVGCKLRGRFSLQAASLKAPNRLLRTLAMTIELSNHDRPALIADWLTMSDLSPP